MKMDGFSEIAGKTPAETTPVMATAAGALELLPNHLYPKPWLFAAGRNTRRPEAEYLPLPVKNPYDLYRDLKVWYRLIDPALADPAETLRTKLTEKIIRTINQAEKFHTQVLGSYYHPNSYAFYCDDVAQSTFGSVRWHCDALLEGVSPDELCNAKLEGGSTFEGNRNVSFASQGTTLFRPTKQDAGGDGTVPTQSGAGPRGNLVGIFATRGYDHQGSYSNEAMLALTQHLIVKIVQGVT
jgi:hypothetical protein